MSILNLFWTTRLINHPTLRKPPKDASRTYIVNKSIKKGKKNETKSDEME